MSLRHAFWAAVTVLLMAVVSGAAGAQESPKPKSADGAGAQRSGAASGAAESKSGAPKPSQAKAAEASAFPTGSAPASGGAAKSGAAKSGAAKSGAAKSGAAKSSTKAAAVEKGATQAGSTSGGASPGAPKSAAAASKKGDSADAESYVVRLRDLESRVDELKEQIRRSHTRLSLLSESVLAAGVGGAHAQVTFSNQLSNAFRITGVLVVLDGAVQYNQKGEDAPHLRQKDTPIFDGAVPPGDHTIQVVVSLRGHGYGVFSYLRGYKFAPRATHSFTVKQGQGARIEVVAWEKGSVTTPLSERPSIRFVQTPLEGEHGSPEQD
jgi:hypothetical protein